MPQDYDPALEIFDPTACAAAMVNAVRELAGASGKSMDSFTGRTFAEIAQMADATYDDLPDFWEVWKNWHAPQPKPDVGDL